MLWLAQATVLGAVVTFAGLAPRLLSFGFSVLLALILAEYAVNRQKLALTTFKQPVVLLAITLVGCAALSLAWSEDPVGGSGNVAVVVVGDRFAQVQSLCRFYYVRGACFGAWVAIGFLTVELLFDRPLSYAFVEIFPSMLSEKKKGLVIEDGQIIHVYKYVHNRGVAAIVLLFAPLIALQFDYLPQRIARWLFIPILAVSGTVVATSVSETAQIAFVVGALIFGLAIWRPKIAEGMLIIGVVAAFALAVPTSKWLHDMNLHKAPWLPQSAKSRILIWDYTQQEVRKNLLFGSGIRTARARQQALNEDKAHSKTMILDRRPGWHTHNAYLQAWFELGLFGVIIATGFRVALIRSAARLPAEISSYALATVGAGMVIAAFGWGMWQTWLLSAGVTGIALLRLAASAKGHPARDFQGNLWSFSDARPPHDGVTA